MKKLTAYLAIALSMVAAPAAFANEGSAISATVSAMQTQMTTDLTTVGVALIAVAAVAVGLKWVKGMLFG